MALTVTNAVFFAVVVSLPGPEERTWDRRPPSLGE
jgi:hypothetical protein